MKLMWKIYKTTLWYANIWFHNMITECLIIRNGLRYKILQISKFVVLYACITPRYSNRFEIIRPFNMEDRLFL